MDFFSIAGISFYFYFPQCGYFSNRNTIERDLRAWLKNYVVDKKIKKKPDYTIYFTHEREKIDQASIQNKKNTYTYTIDLYTQKKRRIFIRVSISVEEFFIILSRIVAQHFFLYKNGVILHGAASSLNIHKGLLFIGNNGAGKSTLIKLISPSYRPISDDIVYLLRKRGTFYICSSIPSEKESWFTKTNQCFPLTAIYFLNKSDKNTVVDLNKHSDLLNRLIKQTRQNHSTAIVHTIYRLFLETPLKNLSFNLSLHSLDEFE